MIAYVCCAPHWRAIVRLRRPHDLADLIRDGRARAGLSQGELAARVGASRQWVSLVENGRTGVAFDLVMGALQALGYRLFVDSPDEASIRDPRGEQTVGSSARGQSRRRQLTRGGKPLANLTPGRRSNTTDGGGEQS